MDSQVTLTKKSSMTDEVKRRGRKRAGAAEADRELEAAKRASVGQLLMKCGRLINERGIGNLRHEMAADTLRTAHTNLFPHIDMEGTRLTELARRVGISKQAVGQLVDDLEGMEVVERVPDPADGRAKLIRFRREGGTSVLMRGMAVLAQIDAEIAERLGPRQTRHLHRALLDLEAWLTPDEDAT